MYALVDGTNFYVSVERVFSPRLHGRPVVVLSNNDGCAIARSNEARALGIKMGDPWFQLRSLEMTADLVGLSANFELYGDMSARLMSLVAGLGPSFEVYSIDEGFASLHGVRGDLAQRAWQLRDRILQWIGIPCGIGIAPTKTLAKLGNHIAKAADRKPGTYPADLAHVCNLARLPSSDHDAVLAATEVGDVWGVGRRIGPQLTDAGITSALDLARLSPALARSRWGVVLERTVRELQGEPCIALDDQPLPRQQIACTRSFGGVVRELDQLIEAVSVFATQAGEKLRRQGSLAGQLQVFAQTSPFRKGPRFSRSQVVPLRRPTADTRLLVQAAAAGMRAIFRPGHDLARAGVILLDLVDQHHHQEELDLVDETGRDRSRLMTAMDQLNHRYGQSTVHVASAPPAGASRDWGMRQERRTPRYTTRLAEVPVAIA